MKSWLKFLIDAFLAYFRDVQQPKLEVQAQVTEAKKAENLETEALVQTTLEKDHAEVVNAPDPRAAVREQFKRDGLL